MTEQTFTGPSLTGGCFCGAIEYRIEGGLSDARSCHCSRCRKAFSGAGSAYAELATGAQFHWVAGAEALSRYLSEVGWGLGFCSRCGTTLCGLLGDQVHGVTLGSVNGDPGVRIARHIFVDSKAPWDEIGGDAPRYAEHADTESESP
ncbi:MAG: GFA family protein [Pseudomonadota bacterium]